MKKMESEFGKGLVYNLVLFIKHFENDQMTKINNISHVLNKTKAEQDKILCDNPTSSNNYGFNKDVKWWFDNIVPIYGTPEKALSSNITTFMNGTSDHLYEIECPKKWKNHMIDKDIKELQDKALRMGHGFTKDIYKQEDLLELLDSAKNIAFAIDIKIGDFKEKQ